MIESHLKIVNLQQLKGTQCRKLGLWKGGGGVNRHERRNFSVKNGVWKVKGLAFQAEPPRIKLYLSTPGAKLFFHPPK